MFPPHGESLAHCCLAYSTGPVIWDQCQLQALEEALTPRLRLAGDTGSLTKFGDFLSSRTLEKGTDIILLYRPDGVLETAILPPGSSEYTQAGPFT